MKIKGLRMFGPALMLGISSLLIILSPKIAGASAPYTCTWVGGGGNWNFSNAANWSGCNNSYPQINDGDNLAFDNSSLTSYPELNDDISGLVVGNVDVTGTNPTYSYQINADAITITGGVTDNTQSNPIYPTGFNDTVIVDGNQTITTTDNTGTMFGTLQGSGNLTVTGGGWAQIGGGFYDLENYTGNISSTDSVIELATWTDITSKGSITVSGNAALDLDLEEGDNSVDSTVTYNLPISIGGNGTGKIGALNLGGGQVAVIRGGQDAAVASTLSGPVTLTSNVQVTGGGGNTLNITGPVSFNTYSLSSANANVTTVTNQSYSQNEIEPNIGSNVTLVVDQNVGSTLVARTGALKGTGTVSKADVEAGATIEPGPGWECLLFSGALIESGTYIADLGGTTACTNYNQLIVGGEVNINGSTLDPVIASGFTPVAGDSFEILLNRGGSPINGTFTYNGTKLTEGSIFSVNGIKFTITYKGDNGHSAIISVYPPSTAAGTSTGSSGSSTATTTTTSAKSGKTPSVNHTTKAKIIKSSKAGVLVKTGLGILAVLIILVLLSLTGVWKGPQHLLSNTWGWFKGHFKKHRRKAVESSD